MIKKYDEYRKVDAFGIKELPSHWNIKRGFSYFYENTEKNTNADEKLQFQFKYGTIVPKKDQDDIDKDVEKYKKYTVIQPNDIAINGLNLNYDFVSQRIAAVKDRGIITSAYLILRPRRMREQKYLVYLLKGYDGIKLFHGIGSGLRQTLTSDEVLKLQLPVPPKEEQDQIVRYLDWKTSEIDRFVHQKKKQIKRYEELRQARIDQFSIHGIDDTVSQKDTGLNWLGNIPKHWRMTRLRNNYTLQNGISESGVFFDKGTPFVNYSDVYNNRILPTEFIDVADSNEEQQKVFSVKKGDIFFTRTSETIDDIGIASVCLQDVPKAVFSGFLIRARAFTTDLLPEYVGYYLQSQKVRNYFTKEMNIVIRASLGQNLLKSLYIPVPPKEEQREIIDKLKCILEEFDAIIDGIKREIKLLEELRTKIIADVVTGQIDVRNVVIPEYSRDEAADFDDDEEIEESED